MAVSGSKVSGGGAASKVTKTGGVGYEGVTQTLIEETGGVAECERADFREADFKRRVPETSGSRGMKSLRMQNMIGLFFSAYAYIIFYNCSTSQSIRK